MTSRGQAAKRLGSVHVRYAIKSSAPVASGLTFDSLGSGGGGSSKLVGMVNFYKGFVNRRQKKINGRRRDNGGD